MQSRQLMKELEAAGWTLVRVTRSHHVFKHPYNPNSIPVPHPKKDLPIGTVKSIRERAGLKSSDSGLQASRRQP
ncbi:type II toxin-antitoxin system HicA family toxin [Pseudomonas entomophila]|uniref:type II toxin-antitoxin system HicA family toxin n=1 Tax=Pseudomonas entomophila TaxID=312306 RepID=UPI003EC1476C